jgi:protein-L-isoaspartate(D-aspartate) O-methyltransferase
MVFADFQPNGAREMAMHDISRLAVCRQAYAQQILAKAGITGDPGLLQAFASVPREDFLGPPPWQTVDFLGATLRRGRRIKEAYVDLVSDDPVVLYQDILVALKTERGVNNGSPALHARGLHVLAVRPGETVCHVGAGTGYYSALLSRLVGDRGRVIAVEFDATLATRARSNLASYANVEVVSGNGFEYPQHNVDAVYVNFATGRPADAWVEQLNDGGRLIFPLGVLGRDAAGNVLRHSDVAGFFLFSRMGKQYAAEFLGPVSFVWADGTVAATREQEQRMSAAFRAGGLGRIARLRWKTAATGEEWYGEEDWGLL